MEKRLAMTKYWTNINVAQLKTPAAAGVLLRL
jgi:hypothetical protein